MSNVFGSHQSGTTQVVQNNSPWAGVQPYLTDLFSRGQSTVNSGLPSVQNISQAGLASAQDPNGLVSQAQKQLGQTIGGNYLSPTSNPYLSGAVQQALDQVRQNVNSQFRGDNYGSSANQEFLTKTLANTALPIYAQAYQTERQNQLQATGAAPGLQGANVQQAAASAGLPLSYLGQYGGILGLGTAYGNQTQTSPYYTNPLGNAAGGALAGSAFGPWGAAIGGTLGLLGGR